VYLKREKVRVRLAIGIWWPKQTLIPFSFSDTDSKTGWFIWCKNYMDLAQNKRWCSTISSYGRNYEIWSSIFRPSIHLFLGWLQSSEISSFSVVFNPHKFLLSPCMIMLQYLSFSSSLGPSFLSIRITSDLRSIIYSCMWGIYSSKKQKYLIVKLTCTSFCERTLYCGCRCSDCINMWDVLIIFNAMKIS
jgi:hypothetical protein